jgi:hypothetical protein
MQKPGGRGEKTNGDGHFVYMARSDQFVVPAQAGTHRAAEKWILAFAGTRANGLRI